MKTDTYIRAIELGVALSSTYMAAVTMIQTGLYAKVRPWIMILFSPIIVFLGGAQSPEGAEAVLDLILLGMVVALSFSFWRRGDEAGFGRIFSLNMLMFFPSVLDVSTFNWINLIFSYDPTSGVSTIWIFGVGLLLQITYLTLRYTARFRGLGEKLLERGATNSDVEEISKGQMMYLIQLVLGSTIACAAVYYGIPHVNRFLSGEVQGLPYPHVVIGVVCTLIIAIVTVLYLRGGSIQIKNMMESEKVEGGDSEIPAFRSPQDV